METGENRAIEYLPPMNLVILVVLCNSTIAIACLLLIGSIGRLRQKLVAIRECCDRWTMGCEEVLGSAPRQIIEQGVEFRQLRQLYRQQSIAIDRLQMLGILIQLTRSIRFGRQKWTKD